MFEFFRARALQYEIHALVEGRWRIDDVFVSPNDGTADADSVAFLEQTAIRRACTLLAGPDVAAVKVVRERHRSDGVATTREIFARQAPPRTELRAGRVAQDETREAGICRTAEDLTRRPACRLIGKALRGFLDRLGITPLELLHHAAYARRLDEQWMLVTAGVGQVAEAQAATLGTSARIRSGELISMVDAAMARARQAATLVLPIYGGDIATWIEALRPSEDPVEHRFRFHLGIARHLQGGTNCFARLEFALTALEQRPSTRWSVELDAFAAACLDNPKIVMELLGNKSNLAAALRSIAEMAAGVPMRDPTVSEPAKRLAGLIRQGMLPHGTDALWERLIAELERRRPLARNDTDKEWDTILQLRDALMPLTPARHRPEIESAFAERIRRFRAAIPD